MRLTSKMCNGKGIPSGLRIRSNHFTYEYRVHFFTDAIDTVN